jgi:hypothetical protein
MADKEAEEAERGGKKGKLFLLFTLAGAVAAFVMKKKRDQELDEALWEEPRAL